MSLFWDLINYIFYRKKVPYCCDCKFFRDPDYYHGGGCKHRNNLKITTKRTPERLFVEGKGILSHKELNKNNDCRWFRYESPGPTEGG